MRIAEEVRTKFRTCYLNHGPSFLGARKSHCILQLCQIHLREMLVADL